DLWALGVVLARLALAESKHILVTTAHAAHHEDDESEEQQEWQEAKEQVRPERSRGRATLNRCICRLKAFEQHIVLNTLWQGGAYFVCLRNAVVVRWRNFNYPVVLFIPVDWAVELNADGCFRKLGKVHVSAIDLGRDDAIRHVCHVRI